MVHVRRGAEEAFLAQLALEGAVGQVGMRLARRPPLDPRKVDPVAHGLSPPFRRQAADDRRLPISLEMVPSPGCETRPQIVYLSSIRDQDRKSTRLKSSH